MATGGYIKNGTKFAYSLNSPVSWLAIGQILEAPDLGIEREKVERTVHGTSIFKRSLPGMADVLAMTLTLLSDANQSTSAAQEALRGLVQAGTTVWFRAEVPTDRAQTLFRAIEFQGYVRSFKLPGGSAGDRQECTCDIEFDGDSWTWYNAAASQIS